MSLMSLKDEIREKRSSNFRIALDIGMGIFYAAVGVSLLALRSFVGFPLPAVVAYILGAMLAIGGAFRFYRGLKAILPRRRSER